MVILISGALIFIFTFIGWVRNRNQVQEISALTVEGISKARFNYKNKEASEPEHNIKVYLHCHKATDNLIHIHPNTLHKIDATINTNTN